jgi:hypothetical protein
MEDTKKLVDVQIDRESSNRNIFGLHGPVQCLLEFCSLLEILTLHQTTTYLYQSTLKSRRWLEEFRRLNDIYEEMAGRARSDLYSNLMFSLREQQLTDEEEDDSFDDTEMCEYCQGYLPEDRREDETTCLDCAHETGRRNFLENCTSIHALLTRFRQAWPVDSLFVQVMISETGESSRSVQEDTVRDLMENIYYLQI